MKCEKFVAEANFRRLDVFVAEICGLTRSRAGKLVDEGNVYVDGKVVSKAARAVKCGEVVEVTLPDPVAVEILPKADVPLDVVWQDSDLAVVNKKQGVTVHPANGHYSDTLVNALLYYVKDLSGINGQLRPGIVHRLDKDTSGLMLVAKNDFAHNRLASQISDKTCRRIYVALLEGVVKQDEGVIAEPIARSRSDRKKMDVVSGGKPAETHFQVLERFKSNTFARFELKTGRTHQIRVHAKYIGHPVVGDKTYGYKNQRFNLAGQLLHAQQIVFRHPRTGEEMSFSAPIPDYFEKILTILRNER